MKKFILNTKIGKVIFISLVSLIIGILITPSYIPWWSILIGGLTFSFTSAYFDKKLKYWFHYDKSDKNNIE